MTKYDQEFLGAWYANVTSKDLWIKEHEEIIMAYIDEVTTFDETVEKLMDFMYMSYTEALKHLNKEVEGILCV